MNALGPPGEQRCRPYKLTMTAEFDNTLRLDTLEFVNGDEMAVDEAGIRERPEMLGWLQLW
jgi:hypothetical protein